MKALNADVSHSETKMNIQPANSNAPASRALDRMLATLERQAIQEQIVRSFRAFACGFGEGPSELDLRTFARLAIVEQRAARALGRFEDVALVREYPSGLEASK